MSKLDWHDGIRIDVTDGKSGRQDVVLVLAKQGGGKQVALQMPLAEAEHFHARFQDALDECKRNMSVIATQ
ncbi:MAG: hypothetical protein ACR2RL_21685 [Gammaproteobacteria bacterium]